MNQVPIIDYEHHPAFAALRQGVPQPDPAIDRMVNEIDQRYGSIRGDAASTPEARQAAFSRALTPKFQELAQIVAAEPGVRPALAAFATKAIGLASAYLHDALLEKELTESASADNAPPSGTVSLPLDGIRRDGYCRLPEAAELVRRVWKTTWWERSVLRDRARSEPRRHCVLALYEYSPAVNLIKRHLRESGALDAASRYVGKPMQFLYAALDHAHPAQDWYANCYQDAGLPTAQTAYMHFDADHDVMKAMLYLKAVGPGNGPFGYIRGSHLWQRSSVLCALQRGFDQAQADLFDLEPDGLDFKLGYYRPRFKLPEYRKDLLALPRSLRGSTHFGDDILDGSALSQSLLGLEERFCGPAGTFVLFDGSRGIHRGSLTTTGERWAIQIGMRVRMTADAGPGAMRSLRGLLGYHRKRAMSLLSALRDRLPTDPQT
jgi:hypothetical protein